MRILIDICHPAHAHFFANPIRILRDRGHHVCATSRRKEMATALLDSMDIKHRCISAQEGSIFGLFRELVQRDWRLLCFAKEYKPDVMAAIGGTFIAHVGVATRIPAIVFYDTEHACLQNALTYPFAHRTYVPECYFGWTAGNTSRYRGYHELSYLHPRYFEPDRITAIENGLAEEGETFFLRLVSWKANHDIAERGWSPDLLRHVVARLASRGRLIISSEAELPQEFAHYQYSGAPELVHHVLAFCRGYVGESATMASEAAVLGVPAVYAARSRRGYTNEQERAYELVKNLQILNCESIDLGIEWMLQMPLHVRQAARRRLLADTIDVAAFVADAITGIERTTSNDGSRSKEFVAQM